MISGYGGPCRATPSLCHLEGSQIMAKQSQTYAAAAYSSAYEAQNSATDQSIRKLAEAIQYIALSLQESAKDN